MTTPFRPRPASGTLTPLYSLAPRPSRLTGLIMPIRTRLTTLLPLLALVITPLSGGAQSLAELPRTWQEEQNYRSGPTPFEPLMAFWYDLDAVSDIVAMRPLTKTLLDREVTLVTIADPMIETPEDALRSGKTIVLLAPSVHGGEVSPKEAVQLVAKELVATDGALRRVLDDVIVLALPLVNPDGGEVRRRTNESGYDMNRDYLKLESQEIHALVTQVLNEWAPDIHVDGHHGGSNPHVITYQGTLNPAADAELRAYPYERIFPLIREAVRAEDYVAFDYSGPRSGDQGRGWGSTSVEPRKHHVYAGLTNSIGILLETPANSCRVLRDGRVVEIPEEERYFHQIRGGVIATSTILEAAADQREAIRAVTTGSRMRAIEAGQTGGDPIVLDYELGVRGIEAVWMPDEEAEGGYSLQEVPVYLEWTPSRTTPRPVGYLLPPAAANVVPLLIDQDIAVYRFREAASIDAEVYYATEVNRETYFQGHSLLSTVVRKEEERLDVVPGWFWVPTAQSRANLISYLMEPETDDNLITWNYMDHLVRVTDGPSEEAQRVPMIRVMESPRLPVVRVHSPDRFTPGRFD
ncbi:MAG: M14 family zinc carboxypeptidase [Longimicrobiales bacterium]|nr:M14 family zinc carboxypeptidase [Longimicrobiales bacterium]